MPLLFCAAPALAGPLSPGWRFFMLPICQFRYHPSGKSIRKSWGSVRQLPELLGLLGVVVWHLVLVHLVDYFPDGLQGYWLLLALCWSVDDTTEKRVAKWACTSGFQMTLLLQARRLRCWEWASTLWRSGAPETPISGTTGAITATSATR